MKKVIVIIVVLTLFYSCKEGDCYYGIKNMKLYSVVDTQTDEHSDIKGWYHSEFQSGQLNFSLEFDHYVRGAHYPKYEFYDNYPDETSIRITCNQDVWTTNADTIKAGQPLNKCFYITKFDNESGYYIYGFLISEKSENSYEFNSQYYTFFATMRTYNTDEMFKDSCIVKRF